MSPGGSVKRSLAMAFLRCRAAIAKAYGLDAATHARVMLRETESQAVLFANHLLFANSFGGVTPSQVRPSAVTSATVAW